MENKILTVPKSAMVIAAHPDDAEFGCGGTTAKWAAQGTKVFYLITTNGDKGSDDASIAPADLAQLRAKEQQAAAKRLGVADMMILPRPDGSLIYSQELRGEVVRYVRQWKPEAILTHDPEVFIQAHGGINHADHRATGAVALDAAYPFARGRLQYPEQIAEGLEPHHVHRIYVWGSTNPTHWEDVSGHVEDKLEALLEHKSQLRDPQRMRTFVLSYMEKAGAQQGMRYAEAFRVVDLA